MSTFCEGILFSAVKTLVTRVDCELRGSKQWRRYLLCGLGACGLSVGATVQAQTINLLAEVQQTFGQRLETTFHYQEAVGPEGVTAIKRYLQVGKRAYVLERYTAPALGQIRVTERYLLQGGGDDTVCICTARFSLGNEVTRNGKTACVGVFHHYITPLTIEAGEIMVVRTFKLAAFLDLDLSLIPNGQTLYVLNQASDVRGDTLACYHLTQASPGHAVLTLQERQTAASRRWHHNTRVTYRWESDLAQHKVTATQVQADGTYGVQWMRTYTNSTDFSETQFYFASPHREGDGMIKQEFYRREFKKLSPQLALDSYTLTKQTEPTKSLAFSITHYYH